jgi:bifunctional UDP-N-acetylglucosamine pyrophosphorylase / glucosamine-1-phosphate N-acetyltransferase
MTDLEVLILAAGQGKRMHSDQPKVLHEVAGKPLLKFVVDAARALDAGRIHVVYGHGGEAVPAAVNDPDLHWVRQGEQRGTGHAVGLVLPHLSHTATVLVLYGDVPFVNPNTLRAVIVEAVAGHLGLVTVKLADATGYGRILRETGGRVTGIVEERDATPAQRAIREANTGIMAVGADRLREWLPLLKADNALGEYYLTDIVGLAAGSDCVIATIAPAALEEVLGVNDRLQLAQLERWHQRRMAEGLLRSGVTLRDPARLDIRGTLQAGRDVTIDVNVVCEGSVVLGDRVRIGPQVVLRNSTVGDDTEVRAHCVIEQADIGRNCRIGPFARVRPGVQLGADVHIGNFVEVKQSAVGDGSKINHLSYVGDSQVGAGVNIGAGTITCNYDGANKYRTVIEDGAFIGSGTELVAPVTVGAHATVGAGSTITEDVPPGELTVARGRQVTIPGWKRPEKAKKI